MSSTPPPPPPPPPSAPGGGGYGGVQPTLENPLINYWKKVVLENFANFEGRSRRAEFWWFALANFIVFLVLGILIQVSAIFWVLYIIVALAVIIPSLAVTVRRLHDTDKSAWFLLLYLVPFVGGIILLVVMCIDGAPAPNQWGPSPKYSA